MQENKRRKERLESDKKSKLLADIDDEEDGEKPLKSVGSPTVTGTAAITAKPKKQFDLKNDDYLKETTRLVAEMLLASK